MGPDALARMLDIPPSQLIAMESGDLRVSAVQLYEVARYCRKPLAFFFAPPVVIVHSR